MIGVSKCLLGCFYQEQKEDKTKTILDIRTDQIKIEWLRSVLSSLIVAAGLRRDHQLQVLYRYLDAELLYNLHVSLTPFLILTSYLPYWVRPNFCICRSLWPCIHIKIYQRADTHIYIYYVHTYIHTDDVIGRHRV